MKPRARRVVIGAAALVAVLVSVLVAANWATVRDHVEAWHFQMTRETETEEPNDTAFESLTAAHGGTGLGYLLLYEMLARYSERAVIFEVVEGIEDNTVWVGGGQTVGGGDLVRMLKDNGYRVLDQRFPRRAYVVIRAAAAPEESSPVMWDGVDLPVPTE